MTYINEVKMTPVNFSVGNHDKTSITIHWWGNPVGQTHDSIISWFKNPRARVSAHYVVSAGRITQMVAEKNYAWHAGNTKGNTYSIGIECNPRMSKGDLETTAQLIANIRSRRGNLPLRMHKYWKNTACPGTYEAHMGWLDRRANEILKGVGSVEKAAPTPLREVGKPAVHKHLLVRVNTPTLNVRESFGANFAKKATLSKNEVYTIFSIQRAADGAEWGQLLSGAGWINLNFTKAAGTVVATGQNPNDVKTPAGKGFLVEVTDTAPVINYHSDPNGNSKVNGQLKFGQRFTIEEEKAGWGKIAGGSGWVHLIHTKRV